MTDPQWPFVESTPATEPAATLPAWLREVDVALAANPQIVLTGNLADLVLLPRPAPAPVQMASVVDALRTVLSAAGHRAVVVIDPADGARVLMDDAAGTAARPARAAADEAGSPPDALKALPALLRDVVGSEQPCCLIVDAASRLAPEADPSSPELHRVLVTAGKLLVTAKRVAVPGPHHSPLYNTVFWLLDRENDLPPWLIGGELARVISIPAPGMDERRRAVATLIGSLPEAPQDRGTRDAIADRYAALTSGLTLRSIREINRLAIDRRIAAENIDDAVRTFRVGVPDNPWQKPALREKIRKGPAILGAKVLGQPAAVRKSVDILIRSAMGLTGAQTTSGGARPQGVLFFAGPTGVGKTELAKSIAELVFGRKDSFLRFDMSEFSAEHTEARLIGAPPGYTGHNSGGELTNAIRQQPFRLVLFDEIEKAHPRILDKFLQILDDGRLSDGNGSTVFFSETLIVFTSNLGVYRTDASGERVPVVARGTAYPEVESVIRAAVEQHFTSEIGRPELLNRIGDNIVVFDFISPETAAQLIPMFLDNVVDTVLDATGIKVRIGDEVRRQLLEHGLTKLDFGGRGVSTTVESLLVNPLARALFGRGEGGDSVEALRLEHTAEGWTVVLG